VSFHPHNLDLVAIGLVYLAGGWFAIKAGWLR